MINISDSTVYPYLLDNISGEETLRVYSSQFGENYQERRGRGINPVRSRWDVTFIFFTQDDFRSFLTLLRNSTSETFLWKPPSNPSPSNFIIDSWKLLPLTDDLWQVSVTLQSWVGN